MPRTPKPPKENLGVMVRMNPATAERFKAFVRAMQTTHGQAVLQLMVRGQAWCQLFEMAGSGDLDDNRPALIEATALIKAEMDLRLRLNELAVKHFGAPEDLPTRETAPKIVKAAKREKIEA